MYEYTNCKSHTHNFGVSRLVSRHQKYHPSTVPPRNQRVCLRDLEVKGRGKKVSSPSSLLCLNQTSEKS